MAWLGLVAIIGLLLCGITGVYDYLRVRKQRRLPPGEALPPSWWTGRHLAMVVGGGIALLAVTIGVLVLVFGSGTTPSPAKLVASPTTTTTTTTPTSASTTSTTLGPARAPQLVRVDVLNASAVARAATTKAAALAALGYRVTNTGNAFVQQGTVVECKEGFAAEAIALARAVGPGTLVQGFPINPPPGSATADCVVVLGQ